MRQIMLLMLAGLLTFGLTSCKNKKESKDIITKMPTETKKPSGPLTMQAGTIPPRTVSWMGGNYRISITRQPDKSLPLVEDASGNKYYDNKVHLLITRADGSTFVDKTYTRADFSKYVDAGVAKKWGLTGFNFDNVADGKLAFAIAIGSPDEMADNEFVPITLLIDSQGGTSVSSQSQDSDDEEE